MLPRHLMNLRLSFIANIPMKKDQNRNWSFCDPSYAIKELKCSQKPFLDKRFDEFPERSPIQSNLSAPEANSTLGDVDITRETGLVPAGMQIGDRVDLLGSDLMHKF